MKRSLASLESTLQAKMSRKTSAALPAARFSCSLCHFAPGTASIVSRLGICLCSHKFHFPFYLQYPHFRILISCRSLSLRYQTAIDNQKCHSRLQQSCRPITLGLSTALRAALRRQSPSCVKDSRQRPPKTRRSTTNARIERRQHNPVAISCASACKSESSQYDFLMGTRRQKTAHRSYRDGAHVG